MVNLSASAYTRSVIEGQSMEKTSKERGSTRSSYMQDDVIGNIKTDKKNAVESVPPITDNDEEVSKG